MANKIAGIGEYVHYHMENYEKYGIARIGMSPKKGPTPQQIHRQHQKRLKTRIDQLTTLNKRQTKALEKKINSFLELINTANTPTNDSEILRIQNTLLEKVFGEAWQNQMNIIINWANGSITMGKGQQGLPQFRKGFDEYSGDWEKKVRSRIIKLNQKLSVLEHTINNLSNESEIPAAQQALENTEKWLLQDLEEIDNELVANGLKAKDPKGKYPNLREYLNTLIQTYAPFISLSKMQGTLFEYVADAAVRQYDNVISKEYNEVVAYIKNMGTQGDERLPIKMATENFAEGMIVKGGVTESHGSNVYKFNNIMNRITESYGKVDATWDIPGVGPVGASLKSVKLGKKGMGQSRPIHISTGNPLLTYLQDENAAFVTHFLNVFSVHNYEYEIGAGPDPNESSSNVGLYNAQKEAYRQQIMLIILYKALTGDVYGRNKQLAEIFVVNNSEFKGDNGEIGKVAVYNMKDILYTALKTNFENLDTLLDISTVPENLFSPDFHFRSEWIVGNWKTGGSTGTQRIAGILNQVYEMKIRASIKNKILMDTAQRIKKKI